MIRPNVDVFVEIVRLIDEIEEAPVVLHSKFRRGSKNLFQDGLQRVLGVFIEAIELYIDPCWVGHCGVWDLLAGGILQSCRQCRCVNTWWNGCSDTARPPHANSCVSF